MPTAKSSQQSSAPSIKQGQLRFSSRRAASSAGVRGKDKVPVRASSSDAVVAHDDEASEEEIPDALSRKRKIHPESESQSQKKAKRIFDSREGEENSQETVTRETSANKGPQKLRLNDARWTKPHREAREKMGNLEPSKLFYLSSIATLKTALSCNSSC